MSKKGWGKFVAFAAVAGAVAAGVSYVLQYKTYHNELEKDFREFEDNDEEADADASLIHGRRTAIISPFHPAKMSSR